MHGTLQHPDDRRLCLRITGKMGPRLGGRRRLQPPRRRGFIGVPYTWDYRLRVAQASGATYVLAHYILRRDWEGDTNPVKVTNKAMERLGLSRRSKWRALHQLEALGLIRVQKRHGKNPVVTIRVRS
jgi:hypothetical protein